LLPNARTFDERTIFFAYICAMNLFILATTLWQKLDHWDKWLFVQLNSRFTNPVFDFILPYFRDSVFWAPLYIFMLVFITLNYGKKGWFWALLFLCTVAIADITSSRIVKESFERLRPCQDPVFFQQVRLLLNGCSGSYSFTSSHAANHFGIATYISITFYSTFKRWILLFYVWAFFVSYAQIYVGVHYPLDVICGALIGVLAGVLTANVFKSKAGSFTLDFNPRP
jgi:membrane-associated phospholipid phosphatase